MQQWSKRLLTKSNDCIPGKPYHIAFSISNSEGMQMQGLSVRVRIDMWSVVQFPCFGKGYGVEIRLPGLGVLVMALRENDDVGK